jgi:hypothetical protein
MTEVLLKQCQARVAHLTQQLAEVNVEIREVKEDALRRIRKSKNLRWLLILGAFIVGVLLGAFG